MSAFSLRWRHVPLRARALSAALAAAALLSNAAVAAVAEAPGPVLNSGLDTPLFYQLLLGELELRQGEAGAAYQAMLDAARLTGDEALFRRAIEIALQARAGEQALGAAVAWRGDRPQSAEAIRYQAQLLIAMNKLAEAKEPLAAMIQATPAAQRSDLILALPRFMSRNGDHAKMAALLEEVLRPWLAQEATASAAQMTLARAWAGAGDAKRALALTEQAHRQAPAAPRPILLALDLMATAPEAEAIVQDYLQRPQTEPGLRLAYVRTLASMQRYAEAVGQLGRLTQEHPELPPPWLSLGALELELHHPKEAEAALQRYVQLVQGGHAAAPGSVADDDDDDAITASGDRGLSQAWLLLSQAAEMRGDFKAAEGWLNKVDNPQRTLEVQTRRATLLARQGKLREARELLQRVPERGPDDARAKLLAEAQVMRDVKHWREANEVLAAANTRFPNDADLLYEQAMSEEKVGHVEAMERLLRKVIEIKPDHQHAYNALGYSLADRNLRLDEAKALIEKALALSPGEPFITDSLGWVEYRLGHRAEALQLLRKAYSARPDTEIAAHLGEVLWVGGERDEARRVLRDARRRDADNEVLRETLARLKVDL